MDPTLVRRPFVSLLPGMVVISTYLLIKSFLQEEVSAIEKTRPVSKFNFPKRLDVVKLLCDII